MKERKNILRELNVNKSWTLFLDRDGVINRKIPDGYVTAWPSFHFTPGFLEAIGPLSRVFGRIVIVTNQRGIARKLMSLDDLDLIHHRMTKEIADAGGRIDKIYVCPHDTNDGCECRKPATGMALRAKEDFPDIDFQKSLIIGDSPSDGELGKKLGMAILHTPEHGGEDRFWRRMTPLIAALLE